MTFKFKMLATCDLCYQERTFDVEPTTLYTMDDGTHVVAEINARLTDGWAHADLKGDGVKRMVCPRCLVWGGPSSPTVWWISYNGGRDWEATDADAVKCMVSRVYMNLHQSDLVVAAMIRFELPVCIDPGTVIKYIARE